MLLHAVIMASGALGAGCPGAGGQGPGSLGTAPDDVVVTKTAIHDNSIAVVRNVSFGCNSTTKSSAQVTDPLPQQQEHLQGCHQCIL